MKIEVTQRDIDRARKLIKAGAARHSTCPIALATRRKTHKAVSVGATRVAVIRSMGVFTYHRLPLHARRFIGNFDCGHKVKPFTFETTLFRPSTFFN